MPSVDLAPPSPPRRKKLDQQGSFEATGLQEIVPDSSPRGENLIMEEPIISKIRAQALGLYNPLSTNLSVPIIVQVQPYER
jgi:hypothetical protein